MSDHGETYTYTKGCRCDACVAGWRSYQSAWKAALLANPATTHGVRVTYAAGCRCAPCREANAAYNMHRKSVVRNARPTPHGTLDGYQSFGCRCEDCASAKRADTRRHYLENQLYFLEKANTRLARKQRDKRTVTARDIARLIDRHDCRCAYCREVLGADIEIDHVVPLVRGGRHAIGNLAPACRKCNRAKSSKLAVAFRRELAAAS